MLRRAVLALVLVGVSGCEAVKQAAMRPETWQVIGAAAAAGIDVACPGCREKVGQRIMAELDRGLERAGITGGVGGDK